MVNFPEITQLLTLTDEDLGEHAAVFSRSAVPSLDNLTPAQCRLVCYRKLFRLLVGIGTTGVRLVLPSCCREPIDNTYPDN